MAPATSNLQTFPKLKRAAYFLLIFLSLSLGVRAQSRLRHRLDSIVRERHLRERADSLRFRMDSIIDQRNRKADFDSLYMERPPYDWLLRARLNAYGGLIRTRNLISRSDLESDMKTTISLGASYKGISLGLALNPAYLIGKYNDYELNLNSYNNRYGYDVAFQSSKTYRGTVENERGTFTLEKGSMKQKMLNMSAYYVFNYRRFSYPAAFSQSFIQRRSCGSFMMGLTFLGGYLYVPSGQVGGNPSMRITMGHLGLGAGYGYNIVTQKDWLFHLSTLPTLVMASRNRMKLDGERLTMSYRFPQVIVVGRGAIIRSFSNYFAGMTFVVNNSLVGNRNDLRLLYTKWQARMVFGVRL